MRIGRVVGRVVLSQSIPQYCGGRWLLVSPYGRSDLAADNDTHFSSDASPVVYDDLGASVGDLIGFTEGGEASQPFEHSMPIDAYNCCLIDKVSVTEA